jgi:hypothetical protein
MTLTIAYRFANRHTEQFVELFEDELYEFHAKWGDITHTYVEDLFLNSGWDLPANYLPQINLNSIREYFDELAERAYYNRLEDLNG